MDRLKVYSVVIPDERAWQQITAIIDRFGLNRDIRGRYLYEFPSKTYVEVLLSYRIHSLIFNACKFGLLGWLERRQTPGVSYDAQQCTVEEFLRKIKDYQTEGK